MMTISHAIYNTVLLGKKRGDGFLAAIALGAIIPDVVTIFYFFYQRFIVVPKSSEIWGAHYLDSPWATAADWFHSLPVLLFLFLCAVLWRKKIAAYFFGSWLLHGVMDFFVHHTDAHRQFLPFSDYVFASPISYWEPPYYGNVLGAIEIALASFGLGVLWVRHPAPRTRAVLVLAVCFVALILFGRFAGNLVCPSFLTHFLCGFEG